MVCILIKCTKILIYFQRLIYAGEYDIATRIIYKHKWILIYVANLSYSRDGLLDASRAGDDSKDGGDA